MGAEDTSKASRFIEGLCGIQADNDESIQRLQFGQIWQQRPSCFRPVHCSLNCDKHWGETFANVITSLPFIVLGLQVPRKGWSSKLYANSLIGVGIASSLYHTSRGEVRKYLRWADYTMIATTTVCLSRALREENPKFLMTASTMLLPFQPMMVSALHMGMMEVSFAKRASVKPELRMAHSLHKMSGLLGGALFFADDCFPETPYLHAAWHLAAALGLSFLPEYLHLSVPGYWEANLLLFLRKGGPSYSPIRTVQYQSNGFNFFLTWHESQSTNKSDVTEAV